MIELATININWHQVYDVAKEVLRVLGLLAPLAIFLFMGYFFGKQFRASMKRDEIRDNLLIEHMKNSEQRDKERHEIIMRLHKQQEVEGQRRLSSGRKPWEQGEE